MESVPYLFLAQPSGGCGRHQLVHVVVAEVQSLSIKTKEHIHGRECESLVPIHKGLVLNEMEQVGGPLVEDGFMK